MIGNAHVRDRDERAKGNRRNNPGRGPETALSNSRSRSRDRDRIALMKGGSGFSNNYAHEKPSAHTAQVRAVFEQLRAGRKAAFLSPLHRASARRREREMAKPMEWWSPSAAAKYAARGERKGIYDIPRGSRSSTIGKSSARTTLGWFDPLPDRRQRRFPLHSLQNPNFCESLWNLIYIDFWRTLINCRKWSICKI